MSDLFGLVWKTLLLRPYVFVFLSMYVLAGIAHLGWRRTFVYIPLGYGLAWLSEYSSIHWGFPYGDYFYIPHTQGQELWVAGVPFMDSLSYVFLSYCSYAVAVFILSPLAWRGSRLFILETRAVRRSWRTLLLGAMLFVLLDIIIDPVALQGSRWFLGQIYGYRHEGLYFGIPMSNFYGWFVVGIVLNGALQVLDGVPALEPRSRAALEDIPGIRSLGLILYVSVLIFNLAVTLWIGERVLALVGGLILTFPFAFALFFTLYKLDHVTVQSIEEHVRDYPHSKAATLLNGGFDHRAVVNQCAQGRVGKVQESR